MQTFSAVITDVEN